MAGMYIKNIRKGEGTFDISILLTLINPHLQVKDFIIDSVSG